MKDQHMIETNVSDRHLEEEPLKQSIEEKIDNQSEREKTNERKFVQVLHDVNLSVNPGDLIGIAGAIGSGKSSLISSILGEVRTQTYFLIHLCYIFKKLTYQTYHINK